MTKANITFNTRAGQIEQVNNVDRVEFTPTHVVIYTIDGELVAYLASLVLMVETN